MDFDDAIHKGYLLIPPAGKILLKKSWQQKYCLLFKASKFGIARLEIYDYADQRANSLPKIITLENVIKITTKGPTYFSIVTKNSIHEFSALSELSINEWILAIQSVAFPDDVSRITSIEEDNDLYCSSGEGVFCVKLHQSTVSQRCGLESKNYTLVLTSTAIQLRDMVNNKLLFTWPYCYIRRYGYKSGKFTFEAGRKCESGEGIFFLEHPNQQEIFRCLGSKMKSMKKMLSGESTSSLLDCGELQFHAALNMEARSRSPLPPSPTSLPLPESNLSSKSQISLSEIENHHNLIKKPKPMKPPRKYIGRKSPSPPKSSQNDYEPISKYDDVEYRSQAWKTLGVVDVSHTEQVQSNEDQSYNTWENLKAEVEKIKPTEVHVAPTTIIQPLKDLNDESYDKLNFFGSTSKLNTGYKQVIPIPINANTPQVQKFNEYDEVQCMEAVRPADDSHLGYALIRKEPGKDNLRSVKLEQDPNINHNFHNNEPYAVISKPKRV